MALSRRGFLQSFSAPVSKTPSFLRPPYGVNEVSFIQGCSTCAQRGCVGACEEGILFVDANGAQLDLSKRGCTYCGACALACTRNVLDAQVTSFYIQGAIHLEPLACVAHRLVICASCRDVCTDRAIRFRGLLEPMIDLSRCTNCGFCIGVCPSSAISITPKEAN